MGLSGIRARTRRAARRSTLAYRLIAASRRARGLDARIAGRRTRICIEGYPSSGNTLAAFVVLRCFPDVAVPEIASHRHCAAAVTLAVRRGVPAIVLVREPAAAIASNAVRFGFSPESAADDYIDFHVAVARELAAGAPITVVEFKNLLGDTREFARIVGRLLGITFDPEQAASAKEDFDAMMRGSLNELARLPNEWTLPHPEKDRLKDDVARRLAADRQRLERAARVYADVVRLAGLDAPR